MMNDVAQAAPKSRGTSKNNGIEAARVGMDENFLPSQLTEWAGESACPTIEATYGGTSTQVGQAFPRDLQK